MSFAKWVFRIAGVYGVLVLVPFYFLENDPRAVPPPPLTHPEYYYGFVGVGLAWQAAFLIISMDPLKYRWMMLPGIVEKVSFGAAVIWLYVLQRVDAHLLPACAIDLTLGLLFLFSFFQVGKAREAGHGL